MAFIGKEQVSEFWQISAFILINLSLCYIAAGGILGLSAIRVQRVFGYGPSAEAERHGQTDSELVVLYARDLAIQERANTINTMRNEAAFASFRNGLFLLITSIMMPFIYLIFSKIIFVKFKMFLKNTSIYDYSGKLFN